MIFPVIKTTNGKLTALALTGLILSGCVGGPGAYFETVSRENASNRSVERSAIQSSANNSDTTIAAVDTNELPPISDQGSNTVAALNTQTQIPNSEAQNLSTPTLASNAPADNSTLVWTPQTDDGNLLLAPQPLTPNSQEKQTIETAYANPTLGSLGQRPADIIVNDTTTQSGFAIGSESTPYVDPLEEAAEKRIPLLYAQIDHGQCKSGRGPKPKKMSATHINPGDPYYIELRMRKTPLLPVGHTYVAYGRLSASGEILDEKLIMLAPLGGYVGAALASGIPMPGVLKPHRDDCRIRPETAYRVSLNAQRYERLLKEIAAAKKEVPSYLLFTNNCNHFMTRIAQSVGLKPPKNIYVPALEYIYAMIESNEGRKIARR